MARTNILASKILLLVFSCFCASYSLEADTLYQGGDALNSSSILVSKNGLFTLGFVRIGFDEFNASYLGIWYNNDKSHPFWLANRDKPIADDSGVLAIDGRGNMKLTYSGGDLVGFYSSQSSTSNLTSVLEDSGNLVLKDANSGSDQILWQSFDYPTDTFLPGMKLGINHRTNKTWSLTSWLSEVVPASGAFTFEWEPSGQELVIKQRGEIYWSSGSLTSNHTFENFRLNSELVYSFLNASKPDEDYFSFTSARSRFDPQDEFLRWKLQFNGSIMDQTHLETFGATFCDGNSTKMGCKRWDVGPKCNRDKGKKYELFSGYFENTVPKKIDNNASLSISDCIDICWKNCSCTGVGSRGSNYANGTGCIFWYGSFTADPSGRLETRYYIINQETKPAAHDTIVNAEESWVWILAAVAVVLIMALAGILLYLRRRALKEKFLHEMMTSDATSDIHELDNDGNKGHNLKVYSAATILSATNNFASENKLGQGGFGPVYKGKLSDGREIAVKRLSRSSGQGLVEFKNELMLIAKLQHMNLVRLLGCSIQGEEKMLVYEYMPNKSLDSLIFDQSKRKLLDWKKRFEIIEGIAQGLLYLHKYSRLRIIHRDLKAGNILLDENLNPKISDFGMAKIFKINELEANTNRVVGTYGYMSPEYMEGVFSVKSDVFSFGVLVLEIVSGKKIRGLLQIDGRPLNLAGYAWELWKAGIPFELVDPILRGSCSEDQVLRCINVGLLCVEDSALDRPTMSDVISMLTSETQLPMPTQPAFSNPRTVVDNVESRLRNPENSSRNYLSTSSIYGR